MGTVDWGLLARALDWYASQGFRRLDLPWTASPDACAVTCPDLSRAWSLEGEGQLVGSAEQAFMQEQFDGHLRPGRYVALTPCFRNEPVRDRLHLPYFMKVELYSNEAVQSGLDLEFAKTARFFMLLSGAREVEVVKTDEGYDLEIAGIEVGSYSCRSHSGHAWTCGTGLAEPRFSTAVSGTMDGVAA